MRTRPAPESAAGTIAATGLRRALRQEGLAGIPIDRQPFVMLARQVGGGLREVLSGCRELAGNDPDHGIHVHWSPDVARVRWRVSTADRPPQRAAIVAQIVRLPGVTAWAEPLLDAPRGAAAAAAPASPRLWFDLVARDVPSASAQLRQLREQTPGLSWWAHRPGPGGSTEAAPCRCDESLGPCSDPALAGLCERGLPVVARPFLAAAGVLGRSERDVVLTLRRWQQAQQLQAMSMTPPGAASQTLQLVAVWRHLEIDDGQRQALARLPGVTAVESHWLPGWPTAVMAGPGAVDVLRRSLQSCRMPVGQAQWWTVRTHVVRPEPLLFA